MKEMPKDFSLDQIKSEEKFSATYFLSATDPVYGTIHITADKLYFFFDNETRPEIAKLAPRVLDLKDIKGFSKGFLKRFHILTTDGRDILLGVWKKDDLIKAIEKRK